MSQELEMKVKIELTKRGMSQAALARMLGISRAYMSDILKGRRTGEKVDEHIKAIKTALNI